MASPIPVAIYGKDSKISEAVREKLLPDIESELFIDLTSSTPLHDIYLLAHPPPFFYPSPFGTLDPPNLQPFLHHPRTQQP